MRIPFRFKLNLICLLGLLILGTGAVVLFSRAWVDLSRAYGLLSINRRLESADSVANLGKYLEDGEWGVELHKGDGGNPVVTWVKAPTGVAPDQLASLADTVSKSIANTRLASGSFEVTTDPKDAAKTYFVAFRDNNGAQTAVATRAHRNLWDLSPWASPFLGFFLIAILVTTALIFVLTTRLTRAYVLLGKAMRDVGAGRLENLELPSAVDSDVEDLSGALQEMAGLLVAKEKKISEVSQLADEDAMTGMKNYRAFTNYINGLYSKGKAKRETFPVLAIVDLDFFKKVNDNYGHQVGDFVLRHISALIKKSIRIEAIPGRMSDFCGRYGGEEFVVIFSECQERSAHLGAMRLMQAIKKQQLTIPSEINEKGMPSEMMVSASIGIAAWDPERFSTKEEWIKEADAALYEAKKRGRARLVRIYPDLKEWV